MVSLKAFLNQKQDSMRSLLPQSSHISSPLPINSKKKASFWRRSVFVAMVLFLVAYKLCSSMVHKMHRGHPNKLVVATNSSVVPSEVFEVTLPHPDFGDPVYRQVLVSHLFANSWGKPAITEYVAPPEDVEFNKVLLTLNTSVEGVQYDRLAHVYLDGLSLWRTSTIEPGGKPVFSTTTKDVSLYAHLFAKTNTSLMVQLDNLMTKRLTGAFNITLEATYYNAPTDVSIVPRDYDDELSSPGSVKHFFGNSDPADRYWSIVEPSSPDRPPLVYQPSNELKTVLPRFNANTTRAKVELFISGNAAEEFWYSNVLDDNKDSFSKHNHPLLGHGPCRVANIFLNDLKIATASPEPTIYTGGISPALWRPIVASGAFDVRALEIELTPLLPLLWGHGGKELKIEISNCIDDDDKNNHGKAKKSSIGENWITTANVLTWESSQVESSSGELVSFYNDTSSDIVEIGGGGYSSTLIQVVRSHYDTYVQGSLHYNLTNGSSINVLSDVLTSSTFSNLQKFSNYGDQQNLVSALTSHHSFSLTDESNDDLVSQTNITHSFPLVIALSTRPIGRDVAYDVALVRGSHASIKFDGQKNSSIVLNSLQNGTSSYYLSPKGNHGTGKTEHKFKAWTKTPLPEAFFERHVIAEDGQVIKDHGKLEDEEEDQSEQTGVTAAAVINKMNLEIKNQDHWATYNEISDHLTSMCEEGLLDARTYEYMISELIHSLNDDFGIASIQRDWSRVDRKILKQVGLLHKLI